MARGVLYVMKTVVPGLVKIGKTTSDNFGNRMYQLEHNGYFNVVGLKRVFAIEVDDYDEKETMLDDIFSRSRVPNSELFALDIDLVVQLLSAFEGKQIYPVGHDTGETFDAVTGKRQANKNNGLIPDGEYYLRRKNTVTGRVQKATMKVKDGKLILPKGTKVTLEDGLGLPDGVKQLRDLYVDSDGISTEDVEFGSPSGAGAFVIGSSCNGWDNWKCQDGRSLDRFRQND